LGLEQKLSTTPCICDYCWITQHWWVDEVKVFGNNVWDDRYSIALYGAEIWTLRAVDQKHLESFEMLCWRRMEKISWTDHVKNEKYCLDLRSREISYMKYVNGRRTGMATFCVETAFYNGLLKERNKRG
jgi:hypothetical protein